MKTILATLLLAILTGCSFTAFHRAKTQKDVAQNQNALAEESAALTTGAVDALHAAPTNPPTALALDLATRNQRIQGLPAVPIDVPGILAGQQKAIDKLQARFDSQESLLAERNALAAKLKETEARLVEKGELYEAEKNKHIVRRIWEWATATLGLGGIIALCVVCPAAIPLICGVITHVIAWVVAKVPALAGAFGVVSKKAFDAVITGVGDIRDKLKNPGTTVDLQAVNSALKESTDADHRNLIDVRRAVLKV